MQINELRLEAQDLNQQGILLFQAGNIDAAKEKFDKAIESDPMLMDSYKSYGDLHMSQSNYAEAKAYYKKALLIEKQGQLYFLYGNACFMNDEVHEGLEYYNLAIANGYDNDEMMLFMGMAYEHLNDDPMALRFYQKAHLKNPSRPDYLVKKIVVNMRLGNFDAAEKDIDILLRLAPEYFDGYHLKTQLLMHNGKIDEAIEVAKSACDKFPDDAELMHNYIRCIALKGDYSRALILLEQAKQMKYFADAQRNLTMLEAEIAAESNDMERAIGCCKRCIEFENDDYFDGEARFMLINLYLVSSHYESALEQARVMKAREEANTYYYASLYYIPFCLAKLGQAEAANKEYKEAISYYRLIALQNPNAVDTYMYRVMCLKDMEEYSKALELIEFIEGLNVNMAETYVLKAEIYNAMGQEVMAKECAKKAYQLKPHLRPTKNGDDE